MSPIGCATLNTYTVDSLVEPPGGASDAEYQSRTHRQEKPGRWMMLILVTPKLRNIDEFPSLESVRKFVSARELRSMGNTGAP